MSTKKYFCEKCESLLNERFDNGMMYECTKCGNKYEPDENDVIMEQYVGDLGNAQHSSIMVKLAPFSPADTKVRRKCNSCERVIMARTQVGPNMISVYSCVCGNIEY
jgi:DNA-directed RNA polymerase subunit M/transcription elongation factor TFIIS